MSTSVTSDEILKFKLLQRVLNRHREDMQAVYLEGKQAINKLRELREKKTA